MSISIGNSPFDTYATGENIQYDSPALANAAGYIARLRRITPLSPNLHDPGFGEQLKRIQEEKPGEFFEGPTGVPENTPFMSEAGTLDSPRTNTFPRFIDLPQINERLEQLPAPASSRFTSPTPSTIGDGHSTFSALNRI
jgi:hypothetical protein